MRLSTSATRLLRTCPVCGSDAVSSMRSDVADEINVRVGARCGACTTWRAYTLNWIPARLALSRIRRTQRRHRRSIKRDLRLLRATRDEANPPVNLPAGPAPAS